MSDNKKPAIRFKGFDDDWEQRKLGDICKVITKGTTPKDKNWSGPVNYVKTESIDKESGNIVNTCNTSLEEHNGFLKRSQLEANDILFSIVGTLGRVGVVKKKDLPANTNQQIAIIRLENDNSNFMMNLLKTPVVESFIASDSTIGAQPSISLWQLDELALCLPKLEEQEKIGQYFTNLDHLITLHQRKPFKPLLEEQEGQLWQEKSQKRSYFAIITRNGLMFIKRGRLERSHWTSI